VGRQGLEPWTQGLKVHGFDRGDLETAFGFRASTWDFVAFKIMFAVVNARSGLRYVSVLPVVLKAAHDAG
jgi:hypothetical protein